MASSDDGIAEKVTKANVKITISLDRDLNWAVKVQGGETSVATAVKTGYESLLQDFMDKRMQQQDGELGPASGIARARLFADAVHLFNFEIIQPVPVSEEDNAEGVN